MCTMRVSGAHRGQKRELEPWSWSYGWLNTTMWVLERNLVLHRSSKSYELLSSLSSSCFKRKEFYYDVIFVATRDRKAGEMGWHFWKGMRFWFCRKTAAPSVTTASTEGNTWSLLKTEFKCPHCRSLWARDGCVNCFTVVIISQWCMNQTFGLYVICIQLL